MKGVHVDSKAGHVTVGQEYFAERETETSIGKLVRIEQRRYGLIEKATLVFIRGETQLQFDARRLHHVLGL